MVVNRGEAARDQARILERTEPKGQIDPFFDQVDQAIHQQKINAQAAESATLLVRLPSSANTPDGAALAANGDIILSVPNFNNGALLKDKRISAPAPEKMLRIDKHNKLTDWYVYSDSDKHRDTGHIGPMDAAFGPDGNLYVADMQIFWSGEHKSRLLRINVENGKAIDMDVVVEGFIVANRVAWKGDTLFVTETILRHTPQINQGEAKPPLLSGVYAFSLRELAQGPVKLVPYSDHHADPHGYLTNTKIDQPYTLSVIVLN